MSTTSARNFALHLLDRAASTVGPFWETDSYDRGALSDALGSIDIELTFRDDGTATGAGDLLLAMMIVLEAAIAELGDRGVSREEAVFEMRDRVSELLVQDD